MFATMMRGGAPLVPPSSLLVISHGTAPFVRAISTVDYTTYTSPSTLPANSPNTGAFSPDGQLFACNNGNAAEKFFIYQTGLSSDASTWTKLAAPGTMPNQTITCMAFSPDSQYLAVGGNFTNDFLIYKTSDWTTLPVRDTSPGANVRSLDFNPASTRLAVTAQTGSLSIYDLPAVTKVTGLPSIVQDGQSLRYSPDGAEIVSGIGNPYGTPFLARHNSLTLAAQSALPAPAGIPSVDDHLAFSPDGTYLVSLSATTQFGAVYDWQNKTLLSTLPTLTGDAGTNKSATISRDSKYLAITQQKTTTEPTMAIIRLSDAQTLFLSTAANSNPNVARYSPF